MASPPPLSRNRADTAARRARLWMTSDVELTQQELVQIIEVIAQWRGTHARPQALVTPGVRSWVSKITAGEVTVGQRLKRLERTTGPKRPVRASRDRILMKLTHFPTMRLTQMEDIAGCRAVLQDPAEVEEVANRIRRRWDVQDESDYREAGKEQTGYRALHIIVLREERLVEIQLRTMDQSGPDEPDGPPGAAPCEMVLAANGRRRRAARAGPSPTAPARSSALVVLVAGLRLARSACR